jgi:hypothetical protein
MKDGRGAFVLMVFWFGLMTSPPILLAQAPESENVRMDPEWVKTYAAGGFSWAYDVLADEYGNLYSTGYFKRNLQLGDGKWLEPLNSGYDTHFLMKHDAQGNLLWVRYGNGNSRPARLSFDLYGDVWVVGNDYGPSTAFTTSNESVMTLKKDPASSTGAFALRYNHQGDLLNAFMIPGGENFDVNDLFIDHKGNFLVAGSYQFRNYERRAEVRRSYLLMKFNPDFSPAWELRGDTIGQSNLQGVTADEKGNVFVTGGYNSQIRLAKRTLKANGSDAIAFVVKTNRKGRIEWVLDSLGTFRVGSGKNIVCDSRGDVCLMTSTSYSVNLISKINRNGSIVWSHTIRGRSSNYFERLVIDDEDRFYLCGQGYGTTFGSTDGNTLAYQSVGGTDPFIACYNTNGALLWLRAAGGKGTDYLKSIALANGKLYAFGWFGREMRFRDTLLKARSGYVFWQARFDIGLMSRLDIVAPSALAVVPPDTTFDMQNCTCTRRPVERKAVFYNAMEDMVSYEQFKQITNWRSPHFTDSFRSLFYKNFQFSTSHRSGFYSLTAIGFRNPITFEHPAGSYRINFTPCTHNLNRHELPLTVNLEWRTSHGDSESDPEVQEFSARAIFDTKHIGIEFNPYLIRPWNRATHLPATDSTGLQIPYSMLAWTPKGFSYATDDGLHIQTGKVCAPTAEITNTGWLMEIQNMTLVAEPAKQRRLYYFSDYPFFYKDQRWRFTDFATLNHGADNYDTLLTQFTGAFIDEARLEIPIRHQYVPGHGSKILLNNHFIAGMVRFPMEGADAGYPGGPLFITLTSGDIPITLSIQELESLFFSMGFQEILIQIEEKHLVVQFLKKR